MVVSSFGLPKTATLDDWKKAADEMNELGRRAQGTGMTMVFHNHNTEFQKLEGQIIYDVLLERLDPKLSKLQFQLWVIIDGYKASDYFRKHPGRFVSAHLYDWSGVGEEQVPLGKGKVDWKDFFDAAKIGGLKNCFVELDQKHFKDSAEFLKSL
jgi:sugar phosphate isomerase/epimerase